MLNRRYGHTTATREVGHCQICEARVKVQMGTTVLHGYKRPGYGSIHGRCPGMNYPPYELSCDRARQYAAELHAVHAGIMKRIADLKEGRVESITVLSRIGRDSKTYHKGDEGYPRALQSEIWNQEGDARQVGADARRLDRRVAEWQPKSIISFEEDLAEKKAKSERSAAERRERAAARDAKRAATNAKQEALKQRRETELATLKADIAALAAAAPSMDKIELRTKGIKIGKRIKAMKWLWMHELREDANLIAIGIAQNVNGYTQYLF